MLLLAAAGRACQINVMASKRMYLLQTGWREVGRAAMAAAGAQDVPIEARLHHTSAVRTLDRELRLRPLPCGPGAPGPPKRRAPETVRRAAAEVRLRELPEDVIWIWSDGSAETGVHNGGGGTIIVPPKNGDQEQERELRVLVSLLCSSTHAELVAWNDALEAVLELPSHEDLPVVACLDSMAALLLLSGGAAAQTSALGAEIWHMLGRLQTSGRAVHLQWVPAHCGLPGNERADVLAKEATALPQRSTPVDVQTLTRAVARDAERRWRAAWPQGWYRSVMGERTPAPLRAETRDEVVYIHQIRAGHWGVGDAHSTASDDDPSKIPVAPNATTPTA